MFTWVVGAPVRRRPKDRRGQILGAAGRLFQRAGYAGVSQADIAAAVGITPAALYRHFPGKAEILVGCVEAALGAVERALEHRAGNSLDAVLGALTDAPDDAGASLGLLWSRDVRGLPDEERRAALEERVRRIRGRIDAELARDRPALPPADRRLLVTGVLAVASSPSFYRVDLDAARLRALLRRAAGAVAAAELPPRSTAPARGPGVARTSRRELLLAAAVEMFAERGYPAVSMEDIGARAGVSAALVYHHFENKAAVLSTALRRGAEVIEAATSEAFADASSPVEAAELVMASYVRFGLRHRHLMQNLVSAVPHLPPAERHVVRRIQHDYLAEWIALLGAAHPGLDPPAARSALHAALTLVNTAIREPASRDADRLVHLGSTVIGAAPRS
jgi:AcrR family transcriptional regulator